MSGRDLDTTLQRATDGLLRLRADCSLVDVLERGLRDGASYGRIAQRISELTGGTVTLRYRTVRRWCRQLVGDDARAPA